MKCPHCSKDIRDCIIVQANAANALFLADKVN